MIKWQPKSDKPSNLTAVWVYFYSRNCIRRAFYKDDRFHTGNKREPGYDCTELVTHWIPDAAMLPFLPDHHKTPLT